VKLADALAPPGLAAIAEFKRKSPSMGDIAPGARVEDVVRAYDANGAAAVSILVDARFGGSIRDLVAARATTGLPLLAKGFFSNEEQLLELRRAGADAVLLLLRDLDDETTAHLMRSARGLEMDALVEAHTPDEVQRALALDAHLLGVNSRDLDTFRIDRMQQLALVSRAAGDRLVVAESGIHSRGQAAAAELAGASAVLVGTSLMQADDPGAKLRDLVARPVVKVCGLTRQEDVDASVEAGADLVGFVHVPGTPRYVEAPLDVPATVLSVSVFVEETYETDADLVQFYPDRGRAVRGREALLLRDGVDVARVLDQPWQGHDPTHWSVASAARGRVVLAGGLGPDNVRDAVAAVRPWGVDATSALEREPGVKDHAKVRAYVEAARS